MKILGIETSCDETAASVVEGKGGKVKVLSNVVSSQIEIHQKYGGVVPEVAAREHVLNILPVVNEALRKAGITSPGPSFRQRRTGVKKGNKKVPPLNKGRPSSQGGLKGGVDAIAVTRGPGLITSLMAGVETAKSLAFAWDIPLIGINHIEGHIYANFVGANSKSETLNSKQISNIPSSGWSSVGRQFPISNLFPSIILTVSGGHTMIILMKDHGKYELIGDTRDDAAGEAFDKAAQLLEIGYPGGPVVSKYARKFKGETDIEFPRPMLKDSNFDFSFSGLKTSILYKIKKDPNWRKRISEYCQAFEEAIVDVLVTKTLKAAEKYKVKNIMLAGGVSANTKLRSELKKRANKLEGKPRVFVPDLKYTTDNAVMIATAGYFRARKKDFTSWDKLKADPNLEL